MKLSELLEHVPYKKIWAPITTFWGLDVSYVLPLDDDTDSPYALRWYGGTDPAALDHIHQGHVIVSNTLAPANGFRSSVNVIQCEDPKASIIAAIKVLIKHRVVEVPVLYNDGKRCYLHDQLKGLIDYGKIEVGYNSIIGGPGFGFHNGEAFPHIGGVSIGDGVRIGSNTCIDRGSIGDTVIGEGTMIDNLVHIAHNVRIGARCTIVAGTVIGGSAVIGDDCFIGIGARIKNKVRIGNGATIGMGAVVLRDVPAGETWVGNPARKLEATK